MATNKECLIMVLDVRRTADDAFKQKSFKCAAEILKDKIATGKKDYVSFVLVGSEDTSNHLNNDVCHEGYLNIKEYDQVQLPTWQLLINFFKFVNEEPSENGEWLDALVVAMGMIKSHQDVFKIQRPRILFFYDFNDAVNDYDSFNVITESLLKAEIELIVVSHNIGYVDNPSSGEPQPVFLHDIKSQRHLDNEKYVLRLVSSCNAKFCNFKEVLNCVFKVENKRPWTWTSTLTIGSQISIRISGIIAIKDESNIKLKKCWAEADEQVSREIRYYIRGNEVRPLDTDLLDGYMLGGTPIVYDEELKADKTPIEPGLKFLGFAKRKSIPDEYFCGESLYWIIHQRGMTASAKKMDALVRALLHTKRVILCWKIFSLKFNTPKIVVLLPNKLHADKPASLSMIELSHHAQHHFWDFPALCTEKTECSADQMEAIDVLIDSMDLMVNPKIAEAERETQSLDLLPFDSLPHIFEQNVMDILERKIICNASEDDEQFTEMLKDKNFVEVFWKVPEPIEEKAKTAAKKVKQLFPLCPSSKWIDKLKKKPETELIKQEKDLLNKVSVPLEKLDIESVGKKSPAADFNKLLMHNVLPITNNTLRDKKFHYYAAQLRSVILELLRDSANLEGELIADGMRAYHKSCFEFHAFEEYNKWMQRVKTVVVEKSLIDFWKAVVVKEQLGPCIVGELALEDKIKLATFYKLSGSQINEVELMDTMELH